MKTFYKGNGNTFESFDDLLEYANENGFRIVDSTTVKTKTSIYHLSNLVSLNHRP